MIAPEFEGVKDLETPERRAEHKARWDKIRSLFPEIKEEDAKPKDGRAIDAPPPRVVD